MKSIVLLFLLSVLVIAGTIGWTRAHASTAGRGAIVAQGPSQTGDSQAINNAFKRKSTNLRLMLNTLLREHAALGAVTLLALYKGADTSRLMQLLDDNQNQLGGIVEKVYGKNAQDTFDMLWAQHMKEYQIYTLAEKNHDTAKMNSAKQDLQKIADNVGKLFASEGKNLSLVTVSGLMQEHINGTLALVDAVAKGDDSKTADLMKAGYDQAGKFADTLSRGMILDKPEMFNK